jgi:hypothetical protein
MRQALLKSWVPCNDFEKQLTRQSIAYPHHACEGVSKLGSVQPLVSVRVERLEDLPYGPKHLSTMASHVAQPATEWQQAGCCYLIWRELCKVLLDEGADEPGHFISCLENFA